MRQSLNILPPSSNVKSEKDEVITEYMAPASATAANVLLVHP
jgi:hypothetical protein